MKNILAASILLFSAQEGVAGSSANDTPCNALIDYIYESEQIQRQLLNEYNQATLEFVYTQILNPAVSDWNTQNIPKRHKRSEYYRENILKKGNILEKAAPLLENCR